MPAERNPLPEQSFLSWPLQWVTAQSLRAPGMVLSGALVVTLLAILVTVNGLKFKTSRLDLLNPRSEYNQRWLTYLDEFGDRDDAVIVVQAEDTARVTAALEDLASEVQQQTQIFDSVLYRRDFSRLKAKGLHYLPAAELQKIAAQVEGAAQMLRAQRQLPDPAEALAQLNGAIEQGAGNQPQMRQRLEREYAQVAGLVQGVMGREQASGGGTQEAGTPGELGGDSRSEQNHLDRLKELDTQYLLAEKGRMGFVLLRFRNVQEEFAKGGQAIGALRQTIAHVRERHPAVWIGLTGMPVIEYDEMQASQADTIWTNLLSLLGVFLLFLAGYGGLRHSLMACGVLLIGMAWSFAFVTLAVGHLNILSAAFAVILIGLGIDFGIHYVSSYLRLRGVGHECRQALVTTAAEVGPGMVTGGVTTAAAFFMAALTEFTGVRELGIVAGGGILLCVLATILVLPSLIFVFDERRSAEQLPTILPAAGWFRASLQRPKLVLAGALAVTLLLAFGMRQLRYDHNLLNLQPRHVESVDIERDLFTRSDDSVWFAVSICDSREQLQTRKRQLEKLESVAKTEEIISLVPDSNAAKQGTIALIHDHLLALPIGESAAQPVPSPSSSLASIRQLKLELARAAQLISEGLPYESPAGLPLAQATQLLARLPEAEAAERMRLFSASGTPQFIAPLVALNELTDPAPPTMLDLPRELTDRFVGRRGKHLLKVYARGNIWEMEKLSRFVADVERVDARITGHPVQTYYASRHMQQSYIMAGVYALVAVFALLLLDFRSIRYSLLAMVPLGLGFVQMCGLIGWLNIPFNPANMIALPLILGIGVDDGVHLVHELRRQRGRFRLSDSTAVAVILTSTTTMASFGSMILARHQGLRSLGQVLTLGVMLCLGSSIVIFPALLAWLTRNRPEAEEDETIDEMQEAQTIAMSSEEEPVQDQMVEAPEPEYAEEPEEDPVSSKLVADSAAVVVKPTQEIDPLAPRILQFPRRRVVTDIDDDTEHTQRAATG